MSYMYSYGIFESIIFLETANHCGPLDSPSMLVPKVKSLDQVIQFVTLSSPFSLEVTSFQPFSKGSLKFTGTQKRVHFLTELPREMYNIIYKHEGSCLKHWCEPVENEASYRSQAAKFCDNDFPHCEPTVEPGLAPIHVSENSESATKSDWDLLLKFNISSWDEKNL